MGGTFSENWHRVAHLRVGLRPSVAVRFVADADEPWYVLHDRLKNGFYRADPTTWAFIARLRVEATVDEVWRGAIEAAPAETPGQEEVFRLLTTLYAGNLLYIEGQADERKALARAEEKKRKPFSARVSELLFMRVPLLDPEPFLRSAEPAIRLLFSAPAAVLALAFVAWGLGEFALNARRAFVQAHEILQPQNLPQLYLAIFVAKALHEFGHAAMCKRFGGEVRTTGVMLLLFTPLPYVDVTASWAMRDRYRRAAVGAAGMLVDLLVAAAATLVWVRSPPGEVNALCHNLMFTTAVYTFVFNLNPLMRFDGYYILSDLVGVPNLHERAKAAFRRLVGVFVLGEGRDGPDLAWRPARLGALAAFFLASNAYRLLVMAGIVLFIADAYLGLGLVVAAALAYTSFVRPMKDAMKTIRDPVFNRRHRRLLVRTGVVAAILVAAALTVPLPDNRVLRGVAEASVQTPVYSEAAGVVATLPVTTGTWVEAGTLLVALDNPELDAEIAGIDAQIARAELVASKSLEGGSVDLAPIEDRLRTLATMRATLVRQRDGLRVRASQAGIWVAPEIASKRGNWVARGTELGRVVDDRTHLFRGVVRQDAATVLDRARADGIEIRLEGERGRSVAARDLTLVPYSRNQLPSAALGPSAGGEVAVAANDPSGRESVEPYFLLEARIEDPEWGRLAEGVRSGRSGWIRVPLPWRPAAFQAYTGVRQFFQRRYRV